jgi:hypothetical protein
MEGFGVAKRQNHDPVIAEQTRVSLLTDVRVRLASLRPKAIAKLVKVTAKAPPKGAKRLLFEMHDVCDTFSVDLHAEDDSPGGRHIATVFNETAIPGGTGVDWDEYWTIGVDPWAVAQQAIIELMADAWAEASGAGYPLPAVICYHDDAREFDLVRRRWVTDHLGQPLAE